MKPRRLGDWKQIADRAREAIVAGEWHDGKRWRAHDELPDDGRAHRSAHDVLGEALQAMTGDGPPDSPSRLAAIRRFERHHESNRDERSASTEAEADAEVIFTIARRLLRRYRRKGRTMWTALAVQVSLEFRKPVTSNRLRMICRQREEG